MGIKSGKPKPNTYKFLFSLYQQKRHIDIIHLLVDYTLVCKTLFKGLKIKTFKSLIKIFNHDMKNTHLLYFAHQIKAYNRHV